MGRLLLNVDLTCIWLWSVHPESLSSFSIRLLARHFMVKTFVKYHNCIIIHVEEVTALLSSSFQRA